jgi:hypothetical protein
MGIEKGLPRNLIRYIGVVSFLNAGVVAWHLRAVAGVHPGSVGLPFVAVVAATNTLPIVGWMVIRRRKSSRVTWLALLPFAAGLLIGLYGHFLSSAPDNVFRILPGEWVRSFQISATVLLLLQACGCGFSIRILRS